MQISLWNVALQTINFLVLVVLLQRFLYRPILAVIAERKQKVAREQEAAASVRQQAEQLKQEYQDKLAALQDDKQRVLSQAHAQAEVELAERRRIVEQQLTDLQTRQTALLKSERVEVERQLREQAVQLGLSVAERLLCDGAVVVDPVAAAQLALRKVAELSKPEQERFFSDLVRHGGELISAQEPSSFQVQAIAAELTTAAGTAIQLTTRVDAKLVQGVELRLGHLSFALHLQAGLARVRAELLPR